MTRQRSTGLLDALGDRWHVHQNAFHLQSPVPASGPDRVRRLAPGPLPEVTVCSVTWPTDRMTAPWWSQGPT